MNICGIYTITNLIDSKIYVGYSQDIYQRKSQHFSDLSKNIHKNIHLQRAYKKHGKENFKFEILEECIKEVLAIREDFWCRVLNTHDRKYGYNLEPTNTKVVVGRSEETRERLSKTWKDKFKNGYKRSMDQNDSIPVLEVGDPIENFHDTLNEMDTDTEEPDSEQKEPVKEE